MFSCKTISLSTCFIVGVLSPAFSGALDLPGGLSFGTTLAEVRMAAQSNGWDLEQTSFSTDAWSIDALGLTLYFCDQSLTSVDQNRDGDLHAFVETVSELGLKYGEPSTEVFILSPHSKFERHGVQSVFEADQGVRISVQIYTKDNASTLWTRTSDSAVCEN